MPILKPVPVFVVMGNDYPSAVFSTSELAEAYCARKRAANKERLKREGRPGPTIYWRAYEFILDKEEPV